MRFHRGLRRVWRCAERLEQILLQIADPRDDELRRALRRQAKIFGDRADIVENRLRQMRNGFALEVIFRRGDGRFDAAPPAGDNLLGRPRNGGILIRGESEAEFLQIDVQDREDDPEQGGDECGERRADRRAEIKS